MFGISIGVKEEWDHGYGTEATELMLQHAFGTLNLNRVWLHVYEDNERYGPQLSELHNIRPATEADRADGFDPAQLVETSRRDPAATNRTC